MFAKPTKNTKAAFLISLAVLMLLAFNQLLSESVGEWSLSAAAGLTMLLMLPVMRFFIKKGRIAGVIFKIDSEVGLKLIDHLGTKYASFWHFIGNAALVLLFGGLGSGFVASKISEKGRARLLGILAFGAVYFYISRTAFTILPTEAILNFSLPGLIAAAVAAFATMRLSKRLTVNKASIFAFLLGFLFFSQPYLLGFFINTAQVNLLLYAFFVGILGPPGYLMLYLLINSYAFAFGVTNVSAFTPTIPAMENGVPVLKDPSGLGISIPIFPELIVSVVVLLILHEGFHGLVARAYRIRVKHTGIATFSAMPLGAFVEPDEEQFKKESAYKQASVFAVGSFANIFVLAVIALVLGNLMVSQGFVQAQKGITAAIVGLPALEFIAPGDVITHINGERLIYLEDFFSAMSKTKPYENATVVTDKGEFVITLGNNTDYKSRGFLNVRPKSDPTFNNFMPELVTGKLSGDYLWLFSIIKWIFIYNLLVGMFNLLPVPVFDGHGVYRNIFSWVEESVSWGKKRKLGKILLRGLMLILLSVLLLNFFPFFAADIQGSIIMLAVFTAFILLSAKFRRSSSRKSRKK